MRAFLFVKDMEIYTSKNSLLSSSFNLNLIKKHLSSFYLYYLHVLHLTLENKKSITVNQA